MRGDALLPGTRLGSYELRRLIGAGGFAHVYSAVGEGGRELALKVAAARVPRRHRRRMQREARIQLALDHPNILSAVAFEELDGRLVLALPLVPGGSLRELMESEELRGLDQTARLALFEGLVEGVMYLHAQGLVHRDLKPANVLLARDEGALRPLVADFGLARGTHTTLTQEGRGLGTPAYMAPEQVSNARRVGPAADLWSLGCILYELVAGQSAFWGLDRQRLLRRVREGQHGPLPDSTPAVRAAITACLQVDPERRVGSAMALLAILRAEPTPAPEQVRSTYEALCVFDAPLDTTWGGEEEREPTLELQEGPRPRRVALWGGVGLIALALVWWLRPDQGPEQRPGTPAAAAPVACALQPPVLDALAAVDAITRYCGSSTLFAESSAPPSVVASAVVDDLADWAPARTYGCREQYCWVLAERDGLVVDVRATGLGELTEVRVDFGPRSLGGPAPTRFSAD